jgi:ribonuclease Z
VLSQKAGMPLPVAEMIVNGAHTSPAAAGMVFKRAGARMSAMWHIVVDHETIGPVFQEMRTQYDGPVVISQDLTVFNVTKDAVVARQRTIDPYHWPVVGPTLESGPPMSPPLTPPAWWADALITD